MNAADIQQLIDNPDLGHGGYIGETIVGQLPGMHKCHPHFKYDFLFVPMQSRIEVKWRRPSEIWSAGGCTYNVGWSNIRPERFDYVILSTFHDGKLYLWLLPSVTAAALRTRAMNGTIHYTLPPFYRTRTLKAKRLDLFSITFDELHSRCLKGTI